MSRRAILCLALLSSASCSELATVERSKIPGAWQDAGVLQDGGRPVFMPPGAYQRDAGGSRRDAEPEPASEDAGSEDASP